MCGIVDGTGLVDRETVKQMCSIIKHRGRDSDGYYISSK